MTIEKTTRAPSDDALNSAIDRFAESLIFLSDLAAKADMARALDALMRYRADREARDRAARLVPRTP